MSAAQIAACAGRLPDAERARFLELIDRANALFRYAVELRREAWRLYRATTGATVRGKSK